MDRSSRPLALGGFMAVGKSTVGALVASRAGVPLFDLDQQLARFGPVAEQVRADLAAFRARESAELAVLLRSGHRFVLATGGGAWVSSENRRLLRARCATVVLTAPLDVLMPRVQGSGRPLWGPQVAELYAARQAAYADCDLQVQTAGRTAEDVAEEVYRWWSASK